MLAHTQKSGEPGWRSQAADPSNNFCVTKAGPVSLQWILSYR